MATTPQGIKEKKNIANLETVTTKINTSENQSGIVLTGRSHKSSNYNRITVAEYINNDANL